MVKIKQKKTMNLPQLIEWAWDNGIKNERFIHSDSNPPEYVWINENSNVELDEDMCISKTDTFTVEVEEEITEDTVIPKALNVFKNTTNRIRNDEESHIRRNVSVKEIKENSKDYIENDRLYIMNDDLTMTLIWRDGKLVE